MTIYAARYCVYLTTYHGNKMPPFYIGSTSICRILDENYHGTVKSKEWKAIWRRELRDHPELFKTKIVCGFDTREEALAKEADLQTKLQIIRKPTMYINRAIANDALAFDWSGKKRSEEDRTKRAEMFKARWQSEDFRQMMSNRLRGRKMPDDYGRKQSERVRSRVWCYHRDTLETRQVPSKLFEALSSDGFLLGRKPPKIKTKTKRQYSEEYRRQLAERLKQVGHKKAHSEETKRKISEIHRGKPKPVFSEYRWWNDGTKNVRSVECPGKSWAPGMLRRPQ